MKTLSVFLSLTLLLSLFASANDLGKEVIGRMEVSLFFGVNAAPTDENIAQKVVSDSVATKLRSQGSDTFKHYYQLGTDRQPVFRSYENWLTPLKPSEEVLLSFEPRGDAEGNQLMVDIELWQSRKKIMKAGQTLTKDVPLYIYGPKWRGGRLIFSITLVELVQ